MKFSDIAQRQNGVRIDYAWFEDIRSAGIALESGSTTITSATITGDLTVDTNTFKVDSTNNRIGLITASPSFDFGIGGQAARIISTERNTTSNTAGNNLTIKVGGATLLATNKAGGNLILASGIGTGTAGSSLLLQTSPTGSTGTSDNALITALTLGPDQSATFAAGVTATGALSASNFSGSSSGTNTGNVTLATIGSTPSANGASLSGQILTLQPCDASTGGIIANATQSIPGVKTFPQSIFSDTVTGAATSAGILTLRSTSHATKGYVNISTGFKYNEDLNYLGLNVDPAHRLQIYTESPENIAISHKNFGTQAPFNILMNSARGTAALPTGLMSGDYIFKIGGEGYISGGPESEQIVSIQANATEDFIGTANGTQLSFSTTPNGSNARQVALVLGQDQSATVTGAVIAPSFRSSTAAIAGAGAVRLANADYIYWRDSGNTANYGLKPNTSNALTWNDQAFLSSAGVLLAAAFPALTGDITTSAGSLATTLATVNSNVGSFGSSTAIPTITVNGKGLVTAVSTNAVIAPAGTLTGTTLASNVVSSSLTSVGTLGSLTVSGSITSASFISSTANVAGAGIVRLAKTDYIYWRDNGNSANIGLSKDTSDQLNWNDQPLFNTSGILLAVAFPALTGDITTSAGALATTLATVNSNVGSFGSSTSIPSFTVNAKGLITAASGNAVIAPAGTLTGATLASNVLASSLTSVGTLGVLSVTGAITNANLTASTALVSDGSKNIVSSAVTSTELGYVSGVTSAIQTQINTKQSTISFAAIGSSPSANAATISGGVITMQPCDASTGGIIANATQSIPGVKVFPQSIFSDTITGQQTSGGVLTLRSTSHATKGNILFGTSAYDEVNNRFGLNIAVPLADFHYSQSNSANTGFLLDRYATSSAMNFRRANGAIGTETGLVNNDTIIDFRSRGWTSAGAFSTATTGQIQTKATETWSATAQGTKLILNTTANTTTTVAAALTLDQDKSATFTGSIAGVAATFTGQLIGKGTATNDSASAGYIGEYIESVISTPTTFPGSSDQWGDGTSISLTTGDWDVTALETSILNTATGWNNAQLGISITSGNSATGLIDGSNWTWGPAAPSASANRQMVIPTYRMSLSGTTTVYMKLKLTFTGGTPQFQGRLSARRVR